MRRVTNDVGSGRRGITRRALGGAVLSAAVIAVMIDPGPAQAATIPNPPAVCHPTLTPGNPVMTSFALTPGSVNVTSANKTITVTVKATDSTKNITSIGVSLLSPKIGKVQRSSFATLHKTSGTAKNGTWSGTATINKWTNNGTWNVTQVFLFDQGDGFAFYSPTGGGSWNAAWPKTFKVTSKPDIVPPTFSSVKISPTTVDTSNGVKTIAVTVKAKDALSGISGGVSIYGHIKVGAKSYSTSFGFLTKKSGTIHNGTFSGKITVPRWVGAGTHVWLLTVSTGDAAGNSTTLDPIKKKAGFAATFKVKSKTDNTKPQLKGLTYSPHAVNALAGPKLVKVTLKASDTLSGVSFAEVVFTSPSGYSVSAFLGTSKPKAGLVTIKGTASIPRCSEPGIWTVSISELVDAAGNTSVYTTAQVAAKHFSTKLSVQALDAQSPTATVPAKVPHAGALLVTFSEPTLWGGSTNPFTIYNASFATVAGTWTCKTAAGATVGCNVGQVKTASFKPTSALTAGQTYSVQAFGSRPTSGIYDVAGNGPISIYSSFKAT
jgi:Bacterial Ig-like domain